MTPPPSPGARIGLFVADAAGGGLSLFAGSQLAGLGEQLQPLSWVLLGVGVACLCATPAAFVNHPGLRSGARALAAVGIALGGAATVILLAAARR